MLKNNFKIIGILCLISSLGRFVLDSYLPSLPAIGTHFSISDATTQLTLTVYLLGFSISQLIYGPLSDLHGRRIVILIGLVIFLSGCFVCSVATSPGVLLISRFITGSGAGACGVLNRAIASDCFEGVDFSRAWSYTTTTLVLTLIFAPLLGGIVQEEFGWRANFKVATFFVAFVLLIILKFLPETNSTLDRPRINQQSILRSYYRIMLSPTFILCTLCYTLAFSGLIIYFQVSPLLYINVFGLTPTQYGLSSMVIASSYLTGGILVNKLVSYIGIRQLLFLGTCLLISGGAIMLIPVCLHHVSLITVLLPSTIYVIGARIVIPNAIAGSMDEFKHIRGSCSALIGCIQMLGSALISLAITKFSYTSPFPLAFFFTCLGAMSLSMAWFIKPSCSR